MSDGIVATPATPVVVTNAPTPEESLDADILRFRKRAEDRSRGVDGEDVKVKTKAPAAEGRDEHGRFLKSDKAAEMPKSEANPPKAEAKPDEAPKPEGEKKPEAKPAEDVEKVKAAHKAEVERHAQRAKAAEDKIGEWETVAERMLARFDAYQSQIKMLQEALQAHGGSIAPEAVENVKLSERLKAYELAEERQKMAREQQAKAAEQQKAQAEYRGLVNAGRQAVVANPELLPPVGVDQTAWMKDNPEAVEFWRTVRTASDRRQALALAPLFANAIKTRKAQTTSQQPTAPKTLAGAANRSGQAVSLDLEDIKEEYRTRARARG
jgi:hypothetical protein